MKLNFWQIVGTLVIVIGLAVYAWRHLDHSNPAAPAPQTTAPAK